MTRASLREYAVRQCERYAQATTRPEKRRILDEVVAVARIHRKAAIRLLWRGAAARHPARRAGRPRHYGPDVAAAAEVLWQTTGRIGAHRLHPFVPELLDRLAVFGELLLAPEVDKLLRQASAATLGRLLAPARSRYPARGATTTRPGTWLKHQSPIRTFTDWDDVQPGFLEIDLVAHCGSSTLGFYLCTLCTVDLVTCWIELEAVWGKGQDRVGGAVQQVHARLPLPLLGLDSDNGSEFINQGLYDYCQRHHITFTRGRAWKKNDSAHVEQKNSAIVRGLVGYDRYASNASVRPACSRRRGARNSTPSTRHSEPASQQNFGYRRQGRKSKVTVTQAPEEVPVTRASLREDAVRQRERYAHATTRPQRRAILDEVVAVTRIHRKAAIRLLRRRPAPSRQTGRAGRPRHYGPDVAAAAEVLWQTAGRIGAHRLHSFVAELLDRLAVFGQLRLAPAVDKQLRQASAATLGRLLAPARGRHPAFAGPPPRGRAPGSSTRSRSAPLPTGTMPGPASWR